jgi:hypothetical protein
LVSWNKAIYLFTIEVSFTAIEIPLFSQHVKLFILLLDGLRLFANLILL